MKFVKRMNFFITEEASKKNMSRLARLGTQDTLKIFFHLN